MLSNQTKIVRQYYILTGLLNFWGLSLTSACYVTYLMKHGLNLLEVNLVNASFFATLFICEIPTGAFADLFGRKKSFVLACLFLGLGKLIYGVVHTFGWFMMAEVVCGIGYTFASGAFQSWFVDSMKHEGYPEDQLRPFMSRTSMVGQFSAAFGSVLGGYLFSINTTLPWWIGAAMMFAVTGLAMIIMGEPYLKKKEKVSMWQIAKKSYRYAREEASVRFVLIVTFIQILASQALNMFWQPGFASRGLSERHYGFLYFSMMMALALGGYIASKIKYSFDERKLVILSQIATGILIIVTACVPVLSPAFILFVIHEIPRGIFFPVKDAYLHSRIPSDERATIASFCAISPHIGGAIGLVIMGSFAQSHGINASWILSGAIFVAGSLMVSQIRRKVEVRS